MVEKQDKTDEIYYVCEKCGVSYTDEQWAIKCEEWCSEHSGSCNLDIIQHAANNDESCC